EWKVGANRGRDEAREVHGATPNAPKALVSREPRIVGGRDAAEAQAGDAEDRGIGVQSTERLPEELRTGVNGDRARRRVGTDKRLERIPVDRLDRAREDQARHACAGCGFERCPGAVEIPG